jgi:hypothetical protein
MRAVVIGKICMPKYPSTIDHLIIVYVGFCIETVQLFSEDDLSVSKYS